MTLNLKMFWNNSLLRLFGMAFNLINILDDPSIWKLFGMTPQSENYFGWSLNRQIIWNGPQSEDYFEWPSLCGLLAIWPLIWRHFGITLIWILFRMTDWPCLKIIWSGLQSENYLGWSLNQKIIWNDPHFEDYLWMILNLKIFLNYHSITKSVDYLEWLLIWSLLGMLSIWRLFGMTLNL